MMIDTSEVCPICSSAKLAFFTEKEVLGSTTTFVNIVKCDLCAHLFTSGSPRQSELGSMYRGDDQQVLGESWTVTYLNEVTPISTNWIDREVLRTLPRTLLEIGPGNQVPLDTFIPIGLGTNIALQSGTELLHPSIDEPTVAGKIRFLKPLKFFAQMPIFIINQASWFWGWTAIWLYPTIVVFSRKFGTKKALQLLWPVFLLHISLVAIGPGAFGRYVMTSILLGFISACALVNEMIQSSWWKRGIEMDHHH
jgi:hypothetical protein